MTTDPHTSFDDIECFSIPTPTSINFIKDNGELVGILTLSDHITFSGNLEESAKAFYEFFMNKFKTP
jgi:hypothetical protein